MPPKSFALSHQPSQEEDREQSEDESEESEQSGDELEQAHENKEENSYESEEATDDDEETQGTLNNSKSQLKSDPKLISQRNGSDSDPDSEGSPSDYRLQPIRKGSVSSSKRTREDDSEIHAFSRDSKCSKIEHKKSDSTPGGRAGCINRLWSHDDEIAVLNGMIEFKTMKGIDPNADMGQFHSFIKGKLKVDFSKDQLKSKIIRLKKRFLNALKRGNNGSDPAFSKPHEVMAFEISKKIWGGAVDNGSKKKVKKEIGKVEKAVVDENEALEKENVDEGGGFLSKYPYLNASFDNMNEAFPNLMFPVAGMRLLEEKLSLIGNVKAKELDDKWKQLRVEETELNCKVLMLMKEQVELALDKK